MGTSYVDGCRDVRHGQKLELWTELEVGVDIHVVAADVPRMAVLDCGGDRGCCNW